MDESREAAFVPFDYAQDGELVEPYLASNDSSYRTTLFVLRVTFLKI
jgi:hypothetical protein